MRYFGGALAFGFAAVWILASLSAALVCLLSAAVGYGAVFVAERTRVRLADRASGSDLSGSVVGQPPSRRPEAEDLSLRADELNRDIGHVYQPEADDTTTPRETPP